MEMNKEEYKALITECIEEAVVRQHSCMFSPEELQLLKDLVKVGNMFKTNVFRSLVFGLLLLTFGGFYMMYHFMKG